jgi:hypothetical protein
MDLKYSKPSNVPYIEFDNVNKFIFSTMNEHPVKGFKYLCFSGILGTVISIGKKKKKQKKITITDRINFTTDLDLSGIPTNAKSLLTPITINYIKNSLKKVRNNDYVSREGLKKLGVLLNRTNGIEQDEWDDDPDITWDGTWDDDLKF